MYTCAYLTVLAGLVAVWGVLYPAGLVDNLESLGQDVGFKGLHLDGPHLFRQVSAIGAVAVVAATALTVLVASLLNVISEITGGIHVLVLEEDITE